MGFVSKQPVPICVDPAETPIEQRNVIYIRPKLGYGARSAVLDAAMGVQLADGATKSEFRMGTYVFQLLVESIVAWTGPDYAGVEVTPAAIRDLDEDDPLVKAVIEEVSRRNLRKEDSDPKPLPPHANGSTGGGLPATEVLDLTAQAVSTS